MSGIKAIFTDMDGTLMRDNFSAGEEDIAAIEKAISHGIKVVPTTGRALGDIPEQIINIRGLEYLVLANGAVIYDVKKRGIIFDDCLDKEKALHLLGSSALNEACYFAMINGYSHYQRDIFERIKGTEVYNILIDFLDYNVILEEDIFAAIRREDSNVEKIVLYFRDSDHLYHSVNALPELLDFDCATTLGNNIEVTKKGVNKAHGIAFLCDKLGISTHEIVTIGDSGNDVDMLCLTDDSYAVANAMRVAKRAAKHLAPANTENAVSYVIGQYI